MRPGREAERFIGVLISKVNWCSKERLTIGNSTGLFFFGPSSLCEAKKKKTELLSFSLLEVIWTWEWSHAVPPPVICLKPSGVPKCICGQLWLQLSTSCKNLICHFPRGASEGRPTLAGHGAVITQCASVENMHLTNIAGIQGFFFFWSRQQRRRVHRNTCRTDL